MAATLGWDALAMWASEPNPFYESWYLLPALRGLDPKGKVKILRFEMGGDLAGIMPIVAQSRYYTRPIRIGPVGHIPMAFLARLWWRAGWSGLLARGA
jgi:hypothetical protein